MRSLILTVACFLAIAALFAQEKMYIHKADGMVLGALIQETDSIYFSEDQTISFFRVGDTLAQYPVSEIDSIKFGADSDTIFITYNGTDVNIFNPLAFEGVSVAVEGSDVTVHAVTEWQDIHYCLSGTTSDGMFKIYSAKRYNLILNGVSITNPDGPAINVQSGKNTTVILPYGKNNTLTDGSVYAEPPPGEDQKGTFFSESKLIFTGWGTLTINGLGEGQHALCSDDAIEINEGIITVSSAVKDGVHAKDGILVTGGMLGITSSEDGLDGEGGMVIVSGGAITTTSSSDDVWGITCDSTMLISGGAIDVTVSGGQSKGIGSNQSLTLSGGTITVHNSGDAVLIPSGSGYDPSYSTAIMSGGDITIDGAEITIVASGKAGRGISSDSDILMNSGSIQVTSTGNGDTCLNSSGVMDAYVATCLKTKGDIRIIGGSVITSSSGSAGKGFCSDSDMVFGDAGNSPEVQVTTTGARILISGGGPNANYAEAKAIRADSAVMINNGTITIASSDDGIKAEGSIEISNATLTISNSLEGLESPFITINSGNLHVFASDDAVNSTFGYDGEIDDGSLLTINGGWIVVNASGGDGLDCNGDVLISGGTTIIHGPQSAPEVGMDFNGSCNVNAGFLVISGTNSFMTQAPSSSSDQYCVKVMSSQVMSSSTLFHIQDAAANDILTFQPARSYYSIIFSSSDLQPGETYSIYTGGTSTGMNTDGLYSGGTYSGGTFRKSFTINNIITEVNF